MNLYIHIPFCKSKCRYCHFLSSAADPQIIENYINHLLQEIDLLPKITTEINTIYFGGGTPSLLPAEMIEILLSKLRSKYQLANDCEITLEANPETLTLGKLIEYKKIGVTRLSLGLQAIQDQLLNDMGRNSTLKDFDLAFKNARSAGFNNINVDLIFGLPQQSILDWQSSLKYVINKNPEHISCYSLELDNNSYWGHLNAKKLLNTCDENLDRQMYSLAKDLLAAKGYRQYEISNFAKDGFFCQHNLDFWHNRNYLGIGLGAQSFIDNIMWSNTELLAEYFASIDNKKNPVNFKLKQKLSKAEMQLMEIDLGLRLNEGILINKFTPKQKTNIEKLLTDDLLIANDNSIMLSSRGQDLINLVVATIIS